MTHAKNAADKIHTNLFGSTNGAIGGEETAELIQTHAIKPAVDELEAKLRDSESARARAVEALKAVAEMPEYDQDDAHRLRNIGKQALSTQPPIAVDEATRELKSGVENICASLQDVLNDAAKYPQLELHQHHTDAIKRIKQTAEKLLEK